MRKLRIGVDVDESTAEFIRPLVKFLHTHGIMVPDYEETHNFNLWEVWGCTKEESVARINNFYKSEEFASLQLIDGAQDAFRRLFPPHEAYPITSRPATVEAITSNFFDKHLDSRCVRIYHTGSFHYDIGKITKADLARSIPHDGNPLDLFIEDSYDEAQSITKVGVPVYLFNRPWNRGKEVSPLITRVDSWAEIVKGIEEIASKI